MSDLGSTLIEVKSALVTLLQARPGLAGVTITYGYPMTEMTDDNIWLSNAHSEDETPVMNDDDLDETYFVELRVQSIKSQGETQLQADTRCVELLKEVKELVTTNRQLGLTSIQYAEVAGWTHSAGPLESADGVGSAFDVRIKVHAFLD